MNGGVSSAQTPRSHPGLSKALRDKLLDVIKSTGEGLPQGPKKQSSVNKGFALDDEPSRSTKRRLDATCKTNPLPAAKKARLKETEAQQPKVKDKELKQAVKTTLQQPKPKRPYASFLADCVDLVHPCPLESNDKFVSEWLESVGSAREQRCRSDGHLHLSDDGPISRKLTRSAPEMVYARDADGYVVPPTPASNGSRSRQATDDTYSRCSTSSTSGVRNPLYRQNNLELNHIFVQHPDAPLPDVITSHVNNTLRAQRDSPELPPDELRQAMYRLNGLAAGCIEEQVATFFNDTIFPNPEVDPTYGPATGLASSSGTLMSQHLVPADPASPYKVTQPKPDKLYGYLGNVNGAFTQPQLLAQAMVHPRNPGYPTAPSQGLRFPFFAIEFKAAGGTRGDLWVATNQCAGASSACLNAIDQLNSCLETAQRIDNLSYCIAVDNNVAQLYISWKEERLKYYLQRVDSFLLSSPEHFRSFRKQVRNILDWGKEARLKQIRNALDVILEENRKKAAERAKARRPPSDGSAASSGERHKSSSSRRASSRSNSRQD